MLDGLQDPLTLLGLDANLQQIDEHAYLASTG